MSDANRALLYMLTFILIVLCLLVLLPAAWAYEYRGGRLTLTLENEIVHVIDGDTFHIQKSDGELLKIRLAGIDSPEKEQVCTRYDKTTWDCAGDAREELRRMLQIGTLVCYKTGTSYDRVVMRCEVNEEDIGTHLVRGGFAWHWPKYSKRGYKVQLTTAQDLAEEDGLGIWQGWNQEPWVFRSK